MLTITRCTVVAGVLLCCALGQAAQVKLDVSPAYAVLKANQKQTTWVRVSLTGFEVPADEERVPVNVALVLDKSGSMSGEKIVQAREAAINAVRRLQPDDIVSVITYDSTVQVLVPATKLTDKEQVIAAISRIGANGNTALFAGVSKGAAELRKFLDRERVNRIVLLSDGKANVGPSSPRELGALGHSLKKENISVSTLGLGLGYNEDLMVQLAGRSGGTHVFVEETAQLAGIFDAEFDDVLSVAAQEVEVEIAVPEGIRPVRVLGNDAEINGQQIVLNLSQIYSRQEKYVVMEVELPPQEGGSRLDLARVTANYRNMKSKARDQLSGAVSVTFSDSERTVEASLNEQVMEDVIVLIGNEQSKLATEYLDKGNVARCRELICANADFLKDNAKKLNSARLQAQAVRNTDQAKQLDNNELNRARKSLKYLQIENDYQQLPRATSSP